MAKEKDEAKSYYVIITREGGIMASLTIPADCLWREIITLFGKACLDFIARDAIPESRTKIEVEIRPVG